MARAQETEAWRQLHAHQSQLSMSGTRIDDLFAQDPQRVSALSFECGNILADLSKHLVTPDTLTSLV